MKINRSFAQISLTAIITSAVFLININFFQKESHDKLTPDGKAMSAPLSGGAEASASSQDSIVIPFSAPIPWSDARDRMDDYLAFNSNMRPIMKTKDPNNGNVNIFRGFNFETAHLMEIIRLPDGTMVDSVLFMFGAEGTFSDVAGTKWPHMRIIAVGVDNNVIQSNRPVYDKADPCPPYCPSGL